MDLIATFIIIIIIAIVTQYRTGEDFNLFSHKYSSKQFFLLSCHTVLLISVNTEFDGRSKQYNLTDDFLYSHHLFAW